MSDIKIFVSSRIDLDCASFDNSMLVPVRCGAVYDENKNSSILGDDTGDNISERRMTFCEFTVQYWAWKNVQADYYGLFHYRRFFNFSRHRFGEDSYGSVVAQKIDEESARIYGLQEDVMHEMIERYDIVMPEPRDVSRFPEKYSSIRDHWSRAPELHAKDFELMLQIIGRLSPEYYESAQEYVSGSICYFCAMHIMKREIFLDYCQWLYPLMFELEKELDIEFYSVEGQRTVGHLGERLLGIYIHHIKKHRPEIRIKEVQTVLFEQPEADNQSLKPAFDKSLNPIPVVFASSDEFAPVCAVAIESLLEHISKSHFYDIVILESEISKLNKQLISSLAKEKENVSIRFFNALTMTEGYSLKSNEHIGKETFYRFLIQRILPEYDKVIYLDGDLVCNRDVAELYKTDVSDYMIAAVYDVDMSGQINQSKSKQLEYLLKEVKLKDPYSYFQAGVLILNTEKMRKAYTFEQWLTFASKSYTYLDQDVLNRYCQGQVKYIDMRWNVLIDCDNYRVPVLIRSAKGDISEEYHNARKDPYIIHYAGFQKPWKMRNVDFEHLFWKYARNTPYYEYHLLNVMKNKLKKHSDEYAPIGVKGALKIYIMKKANKWCPKGTKRRTVLKKLFGRFIK